MKKPTKIIIPSYVNGFKCIGGDCEDSCCIGWDIDIDKKTFKKYARTKNTSMKERFFKHIYINDESYSKKEDYARIASLEETNWCPFLDDDKLCSIYRNMGEEYLSNVCHSFPRIYNILNGTYEFSLYMSCPEAVRMLLSSTEPIRFEERHMEKVKHIVNSSIDTTKRHWKKSLMDRLPELRSLSINIIQNRNYSITERLLHLGSTLEKIEPNDKMTHDQIELSSLHTNKYKFQLEFFNYVIESLGVFNEIKSPLFAKYTDIVRKEFSLDEKFPEDTIELYKEVVDAVLVPFLAEQAYLFEHYLVNIIFQDNFPFSENQNIFDGYVMLIVRFGLIRFYLAGIASLKRKLKINDVAEIIQIHTKIINHHKTFINNILQEIKRKGYDNYQIISLLL